VGRDAPEYRQPLRSLEEMALHVDDDFAVTSWSFNNIASCNINAQHLHYMQ